MAAKMWVFNDTTDHWQSIGGDHEHTEYAHATHEHPQYLLDSEVASWTTTGVVAASDGWADYGGEYGGLRATRYGPLVVLEGVVKRTANLVISLDLEYKFGTAPLGFRPVTSLITGTGATSLIPGAPTNGTCRLKIHAIDGSIWFIAPFAATITTDAWIGFNISYRGA